MRMWSGHETTPTPTLKTLEFGGAGIGPKQCFSETRRQTFTRMSIHLFCPLRRAIQDWFRPSGRSLISQATPFVDMSFAWNNVGRMTRKRVICTVSCYLASFIMTSLNARCVLGDCVGVRRATALIDQARHDWLAIKFEVVRRDHATSGGMPQRKFWGLN